MSDSPLRRLPSRPSSRPDPGAAAVPLRPPAARRHAGADAPPRPAASGRQSGAPTGNRGGAADPVVPLLIADAPVDAAAEAWLTDRALAARAGDAAALAALHRALEPRFDRWLWRIVVRSRRRAPLRRQASPGLPLRPWLAEDLKQETWFALAQTVATWPGDGSFLPWLLAVAPRRLIDRWRALLGSDVDRLPAAPPPADGPDAAETGALLDDLAVRLVDADDARLLLGHLRDDRPLAHFAGSTDPTLGAVYGRWKRVKRWLRAELAESAEGS